MNIEALNINLAADKYISVPVKKTCCSPKLFNGSIKEVQADTTEECQKNIESLAFISAIEPRSFIAEPSESTLFMKSEIFAFGFYPLCNLGSSRHLHNDKYQIKGAGRNQLAIRRDHKHSWGGMAIEEGLLEYFYCHLARGINPATVINNFALGLLDSDEVEYDGQKSLSIVFRERYLPRVAQLSPYNLSTEEISILRKMLFAVGIKNTNELITTHVKNYVCLLANGFYNMSLNPENITIDGRVVDCSSLHYVPTQGQIILPFYRTSFLNGQSDDSRITQLDFFVDLIKDAIIPIANKIFDDQTFFNTEFLVSEFTGQLAEYVVSKKEKELFVEILLASIENKSVQLFQYLSKKFPEQIKSMDHREGWMKFSGFQLLTSTVVDSNTVESIYTFLRKWMYTFSKSKNDFKLANESFEKFLETIHKKKL